MAVTRVRQNTAGDQLAVTSRTSILPRAPTLPTSPWSLVQTSRTVPSGPTDDGGHHATVRTVNCVVVLVGVVLVVGVVVVGVMLVGVVVDGEMSVSCLVLY